MPRIVVIADDLTGAADCAGSSAALGVSAVVLLHSSEDLGSEAWPDTDILSIDGNSRCLPAEQGSDLVTRLVHLCDSHNADCPGYILFKKIDSTLRGNVADEIVALLHARRSLSPANAKLSILMAPALPAQGRTTVDGRLLVYGLPLEQTDIWQSEARTAQSNICQLLGDAGLSCERIDIDIVRSGATRLRQAILQSAERTDVLVCDAETDSDLRAIVEASFRQSTVTALVGSAGLASQIPQAIGMARNMECREWGFATGSTLFVVGTPASVSRQQAQLLERMPEVATFHARPSVLHNSMMGTEIIQSLVCGRDVLLMLDGSEQFPRAFSDLISNCAEHIGGLVLTGGETARAVLDALRIRRLRLLGEVKPGLPFSVADGWARPLPVITKAGAFGSPEALVCCREFLRELERAPMHPYPKDPLPDRES